MSARVRGPRPSLVEDLFALRATQRHHRLENQATTVLARLADRPRMLLARRLAGLFLGDVNVSDVVIGVERDADGTRSQADSAAVTARGFPRLRDIGDITCTAVSGPSMGLRSTAKRRGSASRRCPEI